MNVNEVKENAGPREFNPRDDLPEAYRKAATRMLEFHANSEIMGAYLERPFIRKAPSLERKMAFSAKVQDEIGHGQMLYRAAEALGVKSRDEMLDDLANGDGKFLNCFHYPMDRKVDDGDPVNGNVIANTSGAGADGQPCVDGGDYAIEDGTCGLVLEL